MAGNVCWDWYKDSNGNSILKEGENVSPRSFSTYLAPYHITANNIVYNGYKWNMAHYLDPIAAEHFWLLHPEVIWILLLSIRIRAGL